MRLINRRIFMHFTARYLMPMLVAGGAAAAVVAAPLAVASPLTCTDVGSATQCVSPGNSQLTATPPPVQQQPQIIIILRNHR
jgi:hypothetical protein